MKHNLSDFVVYVIALILFCYGFLYNFDKVLLRHKQIERSKIGKANLIVPKILNQFPIEFEKHSTVNVLLKNGKPVFFEDIASPAFITYINNGFKEMSANCFCNLQHVMPHVLVNHLIVILDSEETAKWLRNYDSRITYYIYKETEQDTEVSESSNFGSINYQSIMMHRGKALLHFLGKGIPVIWFETDAVYFDDLLTVKELIKPETNFVFFDDYNSVGGGFIRFPGNTDARLFYEKVLNLAETQHGKNDQIALNLVKNDINYSVLDKCLFRSGIFAADPLPNGNPRLKDCDEQRIIFQQLNYVVGLENKIRLAKTLNAWYIDKDFKCKTREIKAVILTLDRIDSLKRLVKSMELSQSTQIDLHFSMDRNADNIIDNNVVNYVQYVKTNWKKGFVTSFIWESNAGILKNWVECWPAELYREDQYGAVILLEDDLEMSPVFHHWFVGAHKAYGGLNANGKSVGAVTGQRPQLIADLDHTHENMMEKIPKRVKAFAYLLMATWSLSPQVKVWANFRKWYKSLPDDFVPLIPDTKLVVNEWYTQLKREGREKSMWEIYYIYYSTVIDKQYTLYAWVDGGKKTFVCNWREKGLHYNGNENTACDYPLTNSFDEETLRMKRLGFIDWDASFDFKIINESSTCVLPNFSLNLKHNIQLLSNENFLTVFLNDSCSNIDDVLLKQEKEDTIKQTSTQIYEGKVSIGSFGNVRICESRVVIPSLGCNNEDNYTPECTPDMPMYDQVIVISQFWGICYFHFLIESLPRLMDVDQTTLSKSRFIHVNHPINIVKQFLDLLNYNLEPIFGDVQVSNVVIPPPSPCGGHRSSFHVKKLRSLLNFNIQGINEKHILIVERKSSIRSVSNHLELLAEIKQNFNNVKVHTGSEDIIDQLQLFSNAYLVIAPHGAGLSNMIVMEKYSSVLEFLSNDMNPCYLVLAYQLKLKYNAILFEKTGHGDSFLINTTQVMMMINNSL